MIRVGKATKKTSGPRSWTTDPKLMERARVVLAVSLSRRPPGELVRIIMDWLEDVSLCEFCRRYLDDSELALIHQNGTRC